MVVRLCHQVLKHTKQSAFRQIASTLGDSDIKLFQSELDYWANSIKEEINLLMATTIKEETQENSRARSLSNTLFKSVLHQQEMATKLRVLDLCSTFDHETAWKQTRKVGNTTYFHQVIEYQDWKGEGNSCTLVYTGKLGSGKSVLLANIVDDLNICAQNKNTPVAYFFCKHDISESLKARTIIGSLARQLLRTKLDLTVAAQLCDQTAFDIDDILDVLRRALPSNHRVYFVLDGLDECDHSEKELFIQQLHKLQKVLVLLLCVSYRVEPSNALELSFEQFIEPNFASIPDANPEIEAYIDAELNNCLESKKLVIGEPTLKEEIQDALLKGAQGMFLWVALQIQSLCAMKTDLGIRDALADLPRNLSETFSRILRKSGESGNSYQSRILQLTTAADRPLTVGELREALSVIPGDAVWNPSRLLNDIHAALACCGCLLVVDEEESTVRFVHHSVKQFLLRDSDVSTKTAFTIDSARRTMADIVVTYLNYGVFGTEVSTMKVPPMAIGSASSQIICSTLDSSSHAQKLILKLLKSKKRPDLDISRILAEARQPFRSREQKEFEFFSYAKSRWLQNIFYVSGENQAISDLLLTLIEQNSFNTDLIDKVDWTPLERVIHNWHYSIGKTLLNSSQINVNTTNTQGRTLLTRMVQKGHQPMVKLLLAVEMVDVNSKDQAGMTPLSWAVQSNHEAIIRLLLEIDEVDVNSKDLFQMTPLSWTAHNQNEKIAMMLLESVKIIVDLTDYRRLSWLWRTRSGREIMTKSLFETGKVDINSTDVDLKTPLMLAIEYRDRTMIELLLGFHSIDTSLRDNGQRTPLRHAIERGDFSILKLLLETDKVDVNMISDDLRTPLLYAIDNGDQAIVKFLLETRKIDVNFKAGVNRMTPLSHAIEINNFAILNLLLKTDKVNVNLKAGVNQMTPLVYAISKGRLAMVRLLLETDKVDVNLTGGDLRTPLLHAIINGDQTIVELLLETRKVDVNLKGKVNGLTPLLYTIERGNFAMLNLLLEVDRVDVNLKGGTDQLTPLWHTLERGNCGMLKLLLETGKVNVNLRGGVNQRTPLSQSIEAGDSAMFELLLETGKVDVNLMDDYETPLLRAIRLGHAAMVKTLLKIDKINVNQSFPDRWSPLFWAIKSEHGAIIQLLLESDKFDINSRDWKLQTPLCLAAEHGSEEIVELLLKNDHQIKINLGDRNGETPLSLAVKHKHHKVVLILLQSAKIDINSRNISQQTPLIQAVWNEDNDMVNLLLARNDIKINLEDVHGKSAFRYADELGHTRIMHMLKKTSILKHNSQLHLHDAVSTKTLPIRLMELTT